MEQAAKSEKQTKNGCWKAVGKPLAIGLLAGAAAEALLMLLAAGILSTAELSRGVIPWFTRIGAVAGGFFSGFFAARLRKKQGLLIGGAAGLLLGGCVLVLGLFFSEPMSAVPAAVKLLLYGAAGMPGGVLGVGSGIRH